MAKQLNVNLAFTADTSRAKSQLQDLQNALNEVINQPATGVGNKISKEIQEASYAAAELKVHLERATNVDTGNLDFTKLNQSLKESGKTLSDYALQIRDIGPTGEKAFLQLMKSVANAEVPIKRTSKKLDELFTTLKNSARWEISSKFLHSFESAISSAYGYAQDLNKSLNDIRIVSGQSSEQMAQFAEYANKAAKALSTTTLDYADASLIYYQQGLTDKEVQERTEVTVKMANAAGESATKVSDQLTAVWNNFYDGSKSLEYYADVMTKLGAATASSTDEIAQGLEKFAAVSDTIGLSYEYATAALATVTSNTRESADVVGTAFKTIFSRMQDLDLGETLDDGTTLGQYAEALDKVGINVLDANGNLIEMDKILDQMAAKWENLSKAQQVSLAQSVAGVRQYNQLIALMDNWNAGDADSMVANLGYVSGAEGSLQEQADIYAESWEAANDRMQASFESLWNKLIDDEAFIDLFNLIGNITDGVGYLIDRLGGLKGVLTTIGSVLMQVFSKQISSSISNIGYNIRNFVDGGQTVRKSHLEEMNKMLKDIQDKDEVGSEENNAIKVALSEQIRLQSELIDNAAHLSTIEKDTKEQLIEQLKVRGNLAAKTGAQVDEAKEKNYNAKVNSYYYGANQGQMVDGVGYTGLLKKASKIGKSQGEKKPNNQFIDQQYAELIKLAKKYAEVNGLSKEAKKALLEELEAHRQLAKAQEEHERVMDNLVQSREKDNQLSQESADNAEHEAANRKKSGDAAQAQGNAIQQESQQEKENKIISEQNGQAQDENTEKRGNNEEQIDDQTRALKEQTKALEDNEEAMDNNGDSGEQNGRKLKLTTQSFVEFGSVAMQSLSAFSMFSAGLDSLKNLNGESSFGEISGGLISITSGAVQAGSALKNLSNISVGAEKTTLGAKAATSGFGKALTSLVGVTGETAGGMVAVTGYIALAAAAIAGLVLLFKELYNASSKGQLKQAEAAVEGLKDVVSETSEEAEKLKSVIDSYDSAVDKLKECERGTKEWKEALLDANNAAVEVINSVDNLSGDKIKKLYHRNSDGLIELDETALSSYQNQLNQTELSANYAQSIGDYQLVERQNDVNMDKLTAAIQKKTSQKDSEGEQTSQNQFYISKRLKENLEALTKSMPLEEFKNELIKVGIKLNEVSNKSLASWQSSLQEMAQSADSANEKLNLIAQIKADEILGDEYSSEEKTYAANENAKFSKDRAEVYKKLLESNQGDNIVIDGQEMAVGINRYSTSNNEVYQYILDRLKKAGYDVSAQTSNAIRGTDNNRSLAFLDSNGKEVVYNSTQISEMLAAADALEEMGKSAEKARKLFAQFSDSTVNIASDIVNNFNQDEKKFNLDSLATSLSSDQLSKFAQGEYSQEEAAQALGISSNQLNAIFETLDTSWTQFCQDLTQSAIATEEDLDNVGKNLKGSASRFFNNIQFGSSSLEEKKALENTTSQIFEKFGNEGINGLNKLINWQDSDQVESFAKTLQSIDWTQNGALDEFSKKLTKAGIVVDEVDLTDFVEQMKEVNKEASNTTSLSQAQSEFKEINDAIKNLDWGNSIDPDVYNKLSENSKSYFTLMADGTYKLTGDAEKFYALVMSEQRTNFEKAYKDSDNKIEIYQKQQTQTSKFLRNSGLDLNELGKTQKLPSLIERMTGSADWSGIQSQLDFLQGMNYSQGSLNYWQEQLVNGSISQDELSAIAEAVQNNIEVYNSLEDYLANEQQNQQNSLNAIFDTMTSVEELEAYLNSDTNDIGIEHLNEGLIRLGLNLGIAEEEWTNFVNKVQEGTLTDTDVFNMKTLLQEQQILNLEIDTLGDLEKARRNNKISVNEESTAYEQLAKKTTKGQEALYNYKKALLDCEEGSDEATEALNNFKKAIEQIEVDEAAQNIYDLMEGLKDVPEQDLNLSEYNDDLESIATQLKNIFGQDFKYDAAFVKEQWDLISQYLTGTKEEQYQAALELAAMGQTGTNSLIDAVTQAFESVGLSSEVCKAEIQEVVNILQNADFDANGTLNIDTAQAIANVGTLRTQAEKAAGILNSILGTDITLEVDGLAELNNALADLINNGAGIERGRNSWTEYAKNVTIKARGTAPNYVTPGSLTSTGDSSGGGGSSNKALDKVNLDEVIDRYKEIDDAIDDISRATDRASKAADRLYGKSRINQMKAANDLLQQEIGLLEQKKAQAQSYLATDRAALNAAASAAGTSLSFDSDGNLSNYTSQMTALYTQLNSLIDSVNADGEVSDEEQKAVDALKDKIDALKDAISQYDETKELVQDLEDEITDKFYEWQDNNYEILHYELEIEIELNDLQLEYIDYYLNKIEDDFYSMAEAAQYMTSQIPLMTDSLGDYENFYNKITQAYANGEISQADYVDGMKEAYSSILDQLQALNELDKEMMHYYEDTLDAASEELSKYTDHMEHLTSVLGHYKNLIELINGEHDYESIGKILDGQAKTLKNELDVLTANYKMLLTEKEAIEQSLANAQDDAARELFQEELDAINAAVDEAQENMLAKTEEWAEAQKAIMENAMAEAAAEMEKAFTDGMGFDALSNSLSRLSSYADEYLTKTNQMYETQKLINTAQQAADKSTNEAAKARLNAYTNEIEQLQNKNQLSNLELEIAKAKYDVVLAEIALEEAQNAKSTVRLQRDSEGNFGYVYTSDQEQISQAEQDLADAQNALYNIGLEGANEYGQKLLELKQQLADELVALEEARAAGQYATDEEYYAARDQLIQEYNDLFLAYSEQYTTALGVDAAIQEEAWVNAYENMINKTGDWKDITTNYLGVCEDKYREWRIVVEEESEIVNEVLNDVENQVKDVTDASNALKNEVVNSVIPAMNNQLMSVRSVTSAYAEQRSAILETIAYYERLVQQIYQAIAAQAALDSAMSSSSSSGGGSGGSDGYADDYSRLMAQAWASGDYEAYEYYKQKREEKIAAGYSDWGVSTDDIDKYLHDKGEGYDIGDAWWTDLLKGGGFATGGYTGRWGPEGKIALLHEKELVLNADDTVNFLKGIDIIRSIADSIDLRALREQASILPYYPDTQIQSIGNELEQNVHIEASFPSVQDRNEIQEAFNTLINKASQYANRK